MFSIRFNSRCLAIAHNEIKEILRSKTVAFFSIAVWSLLLLAAVGANVIYSNVRFEQHEALGLFEYELAESDRHPHAAAHFGTWLFKPLTVLSLFDPGVNNYTGTTYRVEAHKQSEMNFAAARDADSVLRLGSMTVATLLQLLFPLGIIFLCSASVSKEYEQGTLKIIYAQGVSKKAFLWGKIMGNYLFFLCLISPLLVVILTMSISENMVWNAILFIFFYAIYLYVCIASSVLISDWIRHSSASLLVQLCCWIFFCIIIPKINASNASLMYPLITYYEFSKQLDRDFFSGINNDGTYTERREHLERKTLEQYGVDSIAQLPINIDGLFLQDAEEYMLRSYNLRCIPLHKQLLNQSKILRIGAFLSPYLSIKQLSRGFTHTDLYHHRHFHSQSAKYRGKFVKTLNLELAKSNQRNGKYVVTAKFLANMEKFRYTPPSIIEDVRYLVPLEISAMYWLIIMLVLIECTAKYNR